MKINVEEADELILMILIERVSGKIDWNKVNDLINITKELLDFYEENKK